MPAGGGISVLQSVQTILDSNQPAIQWVLGALSRRLKGSGREADHSPQNNSKVNNDSCHYFHSPFMLLCSG